MQSTTRLLLCTALLGCSATASQAQLREPSPLPGVQRGYVGLGGGAAKYDLRSGTGSFTFDDSDTAIKLYAGVHFHPNLGLEITYLDMGKARRIGDSTRARGLGLSLVGRLPLNTQIDLLGRLGTLYGRTNTQGFGGYGVQPGKDSGFGLSYGAGRAALGVHAAMGGRTGMGAPPPALCRRQCRRGHDHPGPAVQLLKRLCVVRCACPTRRER